LTTRPSPAGCWLTGGLTLGGWLKKPKKFIEKEILAQHRARRDWGQSAVREVTRIKLLEARAQQSIPQES
jgi:hypothetical protein